MQTPRSFRHLKIALSLVFSVLILGTIGYMLTDNFSFVDAMYTTVNMMATVGHVIHPLSTSGRILTMFLIVLGVGSLLYTFGAGMEFVIEGHLNLAVRRYFMEKKIAALRNHAIICGFGRVGSQIAEVLAAAQKPFVIIDEHEYNVATCIEQGYPALQGDATNDESLRSAGIHHAACLLVATDSDAHNISIALSARHINSRLFIVARANHNETEAKLKLAGADRVLSPYTIAGHRMANLALQPGVIEFFDAITKAGNVELALREVRLAETSPLVGKTIADAQNFLSDGTQIVALKKKSGLIVGSRLETCVEKGDTVIVVGIPEMLVTLTRTHGTQEERKW